MKTVLCLLIFITLTANINADENNQSTNSIKIAVMPFTNEALHPSTNHYGIGLAYDIIDKLWYVDKLIVRPINIVSIYQNKPYTVEEVKNALDADLIVTGTYKKVNGSFSLTLNIHDPGSGKAAAEKEYNITLSQTAKLPLMVFEKIMETLKITLTGETDRKLKGTFTSNPDAWENYLKAADRLFRTSRDVRQAIAFSEEAVSLDSSFANAYTILGNAYQRYSGIVGGAEGFYDASEEALRRSMEINDKSPRAFYSLGMLNTKTGKSEEAVEMLKNGLELNPNIPVFYSGLGYVYRYAGLLEESVDMYRRAINLDSSVRNTISCEMQILKSLVYLAKYDEAAKTFKNVVSLHEQSGRTLDEKQYFYGAMVYFYSGDTSMAVSLYDNAFAKDTVSVWSSLFGMGYRAILTGNNNEVREILKKLEERDDVDGERKYRLVHFYSMTGRKEDALSKLEETIEAGFFCYPYFSSDPLLNKIREEREFDLLLNKARERHILFKNL